MTGKLTRNTATARWRRFWRAVDAAAAQAPTLSHEETTKEDHNMTYDPYIVPAKTELRLFDLYYMAAIQVFVPPPGAPTHAEQIAKGAVEIAEAMLACRSKRYASSYRP